MLVRSVKYLVSFIYVIFLSLPVLSYAAESTEIQTLRAIFNKLDAEIDLARVKVAIDKLADPSIDSEKTLREIDRLTHQLKFGLAPDMMPTDKILSLSAFLYEGGFWNNNQPFKYDFEDPLGQDLKTKLLATYLETKKGNCISMPILYLILADRIGLDVTLSTAPLHVFVKFKDPVTNQYYNLET